MLVGQGRYASDKARQVYLFWLDSGPFDCGMTVSSGLRGRPNPDSQANGAMLRISPLGIFGANHDLTHVAEWARQDAAITHPHPVCQQANVLFTMAIAHAARQECDARNLYEQIVTWAEDMEVDGSLLDAVPGAAEAPPADYVRQQGWVLTAFRNALWQLLHAPNLEEGVVDTVMRGGDTDTNAAICGALLGAVWGRNGIPAQWVEPLLRCRPAAEQPNVRHPRPECFWPLEALELAGGLFYVSPCPGKAMGRRLKVPAGSLRGASAVVRACLVQICTRVEIAGFQEIFGCRIFPKIVCANLDIFHVLNFRQILDSSVIKFPRNSQFFSR